MKRRFVALEIVIILMIVAFAYHSSGAASTISLDFAWVGAVTGNSILVKAKVSEDSTSVRLIVSENPNLENPVFSGFETASSVTNWVVPLEVVGLTPDTQYYYAVEAEGIVFTELPGRARTFPVGPASFTIAYGGDVATISNHIVFQTIQNLNPLFFMNLGDLHYRDIDTNDVDRYRQAYQIVLGNPNRANLYRNIPFVHIWDDHDYGPNNSDRTSPGREAAQLTYREYLPHYPLPEGDGAQPIYHSFSAGRVFFIVSDLRSERSPNTDPDDANKTMMGQTQKDWFKQQLLYARDNFEIIVWVSSSPWIFRPIEDIDNWASFTNERTEIANFIADNNIRNLFMFTADIHMLAIDDGSHSDYSDTGGAGFPVMIAAALDQNFSNVQGGPYSEGAVPGRGQFGLMTVTDNGNSTICIDWDGLNQDLEVLLAWSTCVFDPADSPTLFLPTLK